MNTDIDFNPVKESVERMKRAKVVGVDSIDVYDSADGAKIGVISNGYVIKIEEKFGDWVKIKWGDFMDRDGYIRLENIKDINDPEDTPALINGYIIHENKPRKLS